MNTIQELKKDEVFYDPQNPRTKFEDEDIKELMESIENDGQKEPIHVEILGKGQYIVNEGNKRLAAIRRSKKVNVIHAIVEQKLTPEERLFKQIIIDTHRKNWNMADKDLAWKRLWDMNKYTPESFAKKLSVTKLVVDSFLDRMQLGTDFVKSIDNVSAWNITETNCIKDTKTRKDVLKYAHKSELARKDIRKLSRVVDKVSPSVLKEVLADKISIADAENMVGLDKEKQGQALVTTKGLNKHKKDLKKMLKSGKIKTEDVVEVRKISDLVNEIQMDFFNTSSQIRKLSNKLQYMREHDLSKYSNTSMRKILEGCLTELEDAVIPAINDIKKSLKGAK